MPDIDLDLTIEASIAKVFAGVSEPELLDEWWTETCRGTVSVGGEYELGFGPEYRWKARVSKLDSDREFELTITEASDDWIGTKVGFSLSESGSGTLRRFRHAGWPEKSAHFRNSAFCWALYLRILRRFVEHGKRVAYADRYAD